MTNSVDEGFEPFELVDDIPRALRALRLAARQALLEHKRDGDPVVVWEDGEVRWIPADEILIPEVEDIERGI